MAKKQKYYIRPDGLHEAIRVFNGKRIAFRGKTDAEVERKMIAYKETRERGRLFSAVAEEWKDEHFPQLSPTTQLGYSRSYKDAVSEFGSMSIKDITPGDINRYILSFKPKGYGKKVVSTRRLVLNLIFTKAVIAGDIEYNPCTSVSVPKGLKQSPRELPSAHDISAVKAGLSLENGLLPFFILYTGCRRGEAMALTYGDIDRAHRTIRINKAVYYDHNRPQIKLPKTNAGIREIILMDKLAEVLPKGKPDQLIFSDTNGGYINEAKLRRNWKRWQEQAHTTVSAHQLRHGYATMLFEAGIDARDAQELLGHTTLAMTQGVYTHIRKQRRDETAAKLNAIADKF